jgi:2-hydroxychromene-2-carboxylate isomerase
MTRRALVLYGDFNCPWSYLAALRSELLAADGVRVDWRAVEHDPLCASRNRLPAADFEALQAERDRAVSLLSPDEWFPHVFAGFVPCTRPAVSGYAEACAADVSGRVRRLLFEAFWVNAVDLGDAKVVRSLLVDAIRSGSSDSEALREWGYAIDVTGAPITTPGHRLLRTWREEWLRVGAGTVPVLVADGGEPIIGTAAVQWLGEEITLRGLDVESAPATEPATDWIRRDLPDLSWTSQHGGRWNRAYQDAHMDDPRLAG